MCIPNQEGGWHLRQVLEWWEMDSSSPNNTFFSEDSPWQIFLGSSSLYPKVSNASSEIFHPTFLTPMPFLHSNISNKQSAATLHFQKKVYHNYSPHTLHATTHFWFMWKTAHLEWEFLHQFQDRYLSLLSQSLNHPPPTQNHQNFVHLSYIWTWFHSFIGAVLTHRLFIFSILRIGQYFLYSERTRVCVMNASFWDNSWIHNNIYILNVLHFEHQRNNNNKALFATAQDRSLASPCGARAHFSIAYTHRHLLPPASESWGLPKDTMPRHWTFPPRRQRPLRRLSILAFWYRLN